MSPLPPVAPTPPTAPGVPQVPGVSGPSPTAAVFKSMMAGGQPSAATPAPTTVSQAHLAAPVGKPLFALAMKILWRRTEKSARPAAAARAALFDMGQGAQPSAVDGRKAVLGIYLALPAEVAAFFWGRRKPGGRKKKRKQGTHRRQGSGR